MCDQGQRLELLHKTQLEGIPGALAAFKGRLLAGVGPVLRLYELGKKKLLRKCEYKQLPQHVAQLHTLGSRIFVGDVQVRRDGPAGGGCSRVCLCVYVLCTCCGVGGGRRPVGDVQVRGAGGSVCAALCVYVFGGWGGGRRGCVLLVGWGEGKWLLLCIAVCVAVREACVFVAVCPVIRKARLQGVTGSVAYPLADRSSWVSVHDCS